MTNSVPPTRAQLQAEACIRCGGEDGELVPAGHVETPTGPGRAPLGWAVVAHPKCIRGEGDVETKDADLRVAVDGVLTVTAAPFEQAQTILWQAIQNLPLGDYARRHMKRLLGSGDTLELERLLDGQGAVELPLDLGPMEQTTVRIWRGDGLTRAQRTLARYRVEQQAPGRWAIRDTETDTLVQDDEGTTRIYSTQAGAEDWRRRQGYIAGYRSLPGGVAR
ncbi:hypothetical protein ACPC54_23325 [Kitasatospora sp. NPDC094028]